MDRQGIPTHSHTTGYRLYQAGPKLWLDDFQYPEIINAGVELSDAMVDNGFGDRIALTATAGGAPIWPERVPSRIPVSSDVHASTNLRQRLIRGHDTSREAFAVAKFDHKGRFKAKRRQSFLEASDFRSRA